MYQTTINKMITCSGAGLHSGKQVYLALRPASANTGIVFDLHSGDSKGRIHRLSPAPDVVLATALATTLGTKVKVKQQDLLVTVSTVEHLLATVRGLGIDNLVISVEGGEIPILDGSARDFVAMFNEVGLKDLHEPRKVWRVSKPFELKDENKYIRALPYAGFRVDYTIEFAHPVIGTQRLCLEFNSSTPGTFAKIASARTFGFLQDVEYLHKNGLALGGSLENVIVLDSEKVLNPEGLRFKDEFVRHKILDFIGDMAMLSLPLQGNFEVHCSGHQLNNQFLRQIERSLKKIDLVAEARAKQLSPKVPVYEGGLVLA